MFLRVKKPTLTWPAHLQRSRHLLDAAQLRLSSYLP